MNIKKTSKIMSNSSASAGGGISFIGLLTVVFIVLKLCGVIAWSWWWVLSPIWIPFGVALVLIALVLIIKVLSK